MKATTGRGCVVVRTAPGILLKKIRNPPEGGTTNNVYLFVDLARVASSDRIDLNVLRGDRWASSVSSRSTQLCSTVRARRLSSVSSAGVRSMYLLADSTPT